MNSASSARPPNDRASEGTTADRVYPSRLELAARPTPLTAGERTVLDFFDEHLDPEWEIYVQPHFNGLEPDFVLLHPLRGIGVFEVKDWRFEAQQLRVEYRQPGHPSLWATNRAGKAYRPENPVAKAHLYRSRIVEQYSIAGQLLDDKAFHIVTGGTILPREPSRRVRGLLEPFVDKAYVQWTPLVGEDDLASGLIERVFPRAVAEGKTFMRPQIAISLRPFLREADFVAEQRRPLELDATQRRLTLERTASGMRRIKGPAGSGKSSVLAGRAAQLAAEGKDVLVISFNITLWHYLHDLSKRHLRALHSRAKTPQGTSLRFWHFHDWCRLSCLQAGLDSEFRSAFAGSPDAESGLVRAMSVVRAAIQSGRVATFDAILVDEGQDLDPDWWSALRSVLRSGGEMVLVADQTQDLYGRGKRWTESAMTGAGFDGPWMRISGSYRMPALMREIAIDFATSFLDPTQIDLTGLDEKQEELSLFPCQFAWKQVSPTDVAAALLEEIMRVGNSGPYAWPDVVFLVQDHYLGLDTVKALESRRFRVAHVFGQDDRVSRRNKRSFWAGNARIKGATVHSFKGWESRALVVAISYMPSKSEIGSLYVALTRLKRHESGSTVSVVCSAPQLADFGARWAASAG